MDIRVKTEYRVNLYYSKVFIEIYSNNVEYFENYFFLVLLIFSI